MDQAVVIGSSAGGMMAARVLADYFKKVIVLEKGSLPEKPSVRKEAPQGEHIHVVLGEGQDFLENMFPGILKEMESEGANVIDSSGDFSWFFQGSWRPRYKSGIKLLLSLRPHVDWHLRRRLLADCSNVTIQEGYTVEGYLPGEKKDHIKGVKLTDKNEKSQEIEADLVVDCSGRNSKTPEWLETLGYQKPREKHIGINIAYTTRLYKRPADFNEDWKFFVIYPEIPRTWRAGFISSVQNDQWVVSLNGYFDDHAPTDDEGFMEFAKSLPRPEFYNHIKDLKPVSETKRYRLPTIRRRYYEKLSRFPDGLIVVGDANCVFNPIFGQGITAASLYSKVLNSKLEALSKKGSIELTGFSKAYQKSLPAALDLPWFLTNMIDLSYPQATGSRPFGMRLITWILTRTLEAISRNPKLSQTFMDVLHLYKGLGALLNPAFSLPVIFHGIKAFFVPLEKRAETKEMPQISEISYVEK